MTAAPQGKLVPAPTLAAGGWRCVVASLSRPWDENQLPEGVEAHSPVCRCL